MWFRGLVRFIGVALATSLLATAITVAGAWFVLGWHTTDEIGDAVFWATLIVCGLIYLVTPRHAFGHTVADAKIRLLNSQLECYLLLVVVGAIMMGISYLLGIAG